MVMFRYMSMNYPTLDIDQINAILTVAESAAGDPSYLNPENCPYDRGTVEKLQQLITAAQLNAPAASKEKEKKGRGRPTKNQVQDLDEVDKELDDLRKELNQLKLDSKALETNDRIQIIKTRAALFERILNMKERVINMKQQLHFMEVVIGLMQDHMSQEDRDKFMKELKPFVDGER